MFVFQFPWCKVLLLDIYQNLRLLRLNCQEPFFQENLSSLWRFYNDHFIPKIMILRASVLILQALEKQHSIFLIRHFLIWRLLWAKFCQHNILNQEKAFSNLFYMPRLFSLIRDNCIQATSSGMGGGVVKIFWVKRFHFYYQFN